MFRLWLDGINGVSNAPSASGPFRCFVPEFAEFRRAADLFQALQDRGELTVRTCEEVLGDPIAADKVTGSALVEAQKEELEYKRTADGAPWTRGAPPSDELVLVPRSLFQVFH